MRIVAAFALFVTAVAQQAATPSTAPRPGPRSQPALLYDEQHQRLLLIDGTYPAVQRGSSEVWSWDGKQWARVQ